MKRPEVERMRALLVEAITTLCRSGLPYSDNLKVEGLIGITLDEADIILVNLNKTFGHGMGEIPSLEKYQKDRDRATLSDEEASRDSTGDAMSPQGTRKKERRKRRRNSGAFTDGKRPLRDSGTNQDSETEQQIQVLNTFSVASPEKPTNRTNRRSTDFDTVPSASSEESALTVHDKRSASLQDNQESNENKDSAPAPETVVKIEIDSDQDIEEVKVEPSPSASCSRVPALPNYQQQGSLSDSFPPDLSQSMPSLSASDIQGELYSSQLPPELSAVASSESGPVPVGMFSSPVSHSSPIAGPSGLNMPTVGSSLYSQSPGGGQLGAIQQRNKDEDFLQGFDLEMWDDTAAGEISWGQSVQNYQLPPMPIQVLPALQSRQPSGFLPRSKNRSLIVDTLWSDLQRRNIIYPSAKMVSMMFNTLFRRYPFLGSRESWKASFKGKAKRERRPLMPDGVVAQIRAKYGRPGTSGRKKKSLVSGSEQTSLESTEHADPVIPEQTNLGN